VMGHFVFRRLAFVQTVAGVLLLQVFCPACTFSQGIVWQDNGKAICTATGSQISPQLAPDGAGGAIVVWEEEYDIHAQRINSWGDPLWLPEGVLICTSFWGGEMAPQIIPDGTGGAIIAWMDCRDWTYGIYAQAIGQDGTVLWAPNGISVCASSHLPVDLVIASDGAGGAVLAWSSDWEDIFSAAINSSGAPRWSTSGVVVCDASGHQVSPQIATDGASGAIITWEDERDSEDYPRIYAQRLDASGNPVWALNGVALGSRNDQWSPQIISDGAGGAIITWDEWSDDTCWDIYAQRIDGSGNLLWGANGAGMCTIYPDQMHPQITSDGQGNAIIAWLDDRGAGTDNDIYAQKVNLQGQHVWTANGVPVCTDEEEQDGPCLLVGDGLGGAFIVWHDMRGSPNPLSLWPDESIYCQALDSSGNPRYATDGIRICVADYDPKEYAIASVASGSAIIAWRDLRPGRDLDLYGQRVTIYAVPPSPTPTPTPMPSPAPALRYDFGGSAEGWVFSGPVYPFDAPNSGAYNSTLWLGTTNNTNVFGYWDSPGGAVPVSPAYLYLARFYLVCADQVQALVPVLRVRAVGSNMQQVDWVEVASQGLGESSPDSAGRWYDLFFAPAVGASSASLAFDVLNFDPSDAAQATVGLDAVEVYAYDAADVSVASAAHHYTFDTGAEGWVFSGEIPPFTQLNTGVYFGALHLASLNNTNSFGYWHSPAGDIAMGATPTLYRATWSVHSDQTNPSLVPDLRLRLYTSNFQITAGKECPSAGSGDNSPTQSGRTYSVYFWSSNSAVATNLQCAFDLLNFSPDDAANGTLSLDDVNLETVNLPWYP
jgi:hypothetical protein